ncbi:hypothetical protein GSI_15598 [Ganoderma sinense ZZ0214-1]|uniref:F-box domain-containing protein n=1 Tax=Ganoderma sinense ZZ0214-1 TaxID=1077348 RepID=A0A2G8RN10_9APHY|nr:hypothetical protein GSI_15598 [Ganoderma sinense ZZ0214-1]
MSLNMDIMHIVMSYADRRVVSNLMKTCKTLNSEGVKYLLEDGVSLRRKRTLKSFNRFLSARKNVKQCIRRLAFLKRLSLDFYHPSEASARLLEGIFEILVQVSSDFASLEIFNAEVLLAAHPPLGAAIAKLTTLKTLNVSDAGGDHCATLLRTHQSSLTSVDINFNAANEDPGDAAAGRSYMNPILLLERSQSTLESLSTTFSASSPDGPCYANVTSLSITCIDLPVIEDYIRAFPNLLSLSSFECCGFREEDQERWEDRRATSMLHQARHGTWRSLRHYVGSVLDLWTFGLTCRIQTVKMGFPQSTVDPTMLNDVLSHARPSALHLTLPGALCLLDAAVLSVLSVERGLRELDLRVLLHLNGNDQAVSVPVVLDLLVDLVRAAAVPTFRLKLDMSWMRAGSDGEEPPPTMPFEAYLQDMDVDAYADTLLARVASLKEVQVSVVRLREGPTRQADRKRPQSGGGNLNTTDASDQGPGDGDEV